MASFFTETVTNLSEFCRKHELLCLFCLVYLVYNINGRPIGSGDTLPASLLPFSILDNHNLYLDQFAYYFKSNFERAYWISTIDEHSLSIYPIVTPVLLLPFYLLAFLFIKFANIPIDMFDPRFSLIVPVMEKLAASLIASLSVIFIFLSLKELIDRRTAAIVAIIFAFATNTWTISSQGLWQHGFVELFLAMLIYLVLINEKRASNKIIICSGTISGLLIFNRPADSILLIPILYYIVGLKDRRIAYYLFAMFLSGAPFLLYNIHYFGNLFGGMSALLGGFNGRFGSIVPYVGLLISPSRGLFVYTPIVLLSILGYFKISQISDIKIQKFLMMFGFSIPIQIIVYGSFEMWWAGWSYGPRFLTGMLPVLAVFVGLYMKDLHLNLRDSKNLLLICIISFLLIWSIFVQFVGAFYYPNGNWDGDPNVDLHPEKLWDWKDTQIIRSFSAGIVSPAKYLHFLLNMMDPAKTIDIIEGGTLEKGWHGIEVWDGVSTRWMENDAQIFLNSSENCTANLSIRLTSFFRSRTLDIYIADVLVVQIAVPTRFIDVGVPVPLEKGANTIRLHVPEGCERPCDKWGRSNSDCRCLSIAVRNLTFEPG